MALSFTLPGLGSVGAGDLLGAGSAASSLVGGILGAEGAQQAGAAASRADLANAAIQGGNAGTAWQSYYRQQRGLDYSRNALEGKQRAAYGAAGVTGDGSPLDVMADTEQQYSTQGLNLFYNAKARANSAGTQAEADTEAAAAARKAADTQSQNALIGGIGSALFSVGKLFAL